MAWTIKLAGNAKRDLNKMDDNVSQRILGFLHGRVALLDDPRSIGEALRGAKFGESWKYHVGDYRIIATIRDLELEILVIRAGNRREVYR